jgi:hypothetical protein
MNRSNPIDYSISQGRENPLTIDPFFKNPYVLWENPIVRTPQHYVSQALQ